MEWIESWPTGIKVLVIVGVLIVGIIAWRFYVSRKDEAEDEDKKG